MQFASAPVLIENPSGRVTLAAAIEFESAELLHSSIEITDGFNTWDAEFGQSPGRRQVCPSCIGHAA